jgi:hypothetical protein
MPAARAAGHRSTQSRHLNRNGIVALVAADADRIRHAIPAHAPPGVAQAAQHPDPRPYATRGGTSWRSPQIPAQTPPAVALQAADTLAGPKSAGNSLRNATSDGVWQIGSRTAANSRDIAGLTPLE